MEPNQKGDQTSFLEKPPVPPAPRQRRQRLKLIIIGSVGLVLLVAIVFYYLRFIAPYESTDDAFVEGYVTIMSSRVPGPVTRLAVRDNQLVKTGDLLVEIDPRDYETSLTQAQADLAGQF